MTQATILRELSHGESLFYKAALSNSAWSKIAGNIPVRVLQACLNVLIQKHAFLQCVVNENDNNCYFTQRKTEEHIHQLELLNQTALSYEQQVHNYFQQTLNTSIDAQQTLIEVTCLRPSHNSADETYLVWRLSHIISDGICLIDLHREFLSLCDQMLNIGGLVTRCSDSDNAIPACIESRLPSRSDGKTIEDMIESYLKVIDQAPHQILYPESAVSNGQHFQTEQHIEVITHRLSEPDTAAVLAWCKLRKLSFNDAFTAALFLTAQRLTKQNTFLLRTAVNLRGKVEPAIDKNQVMTAASSIITSTSIGKYEGKT